MNQAIAQGALARSQRANRAVRRCVWQVVLDRITSPALYHIAPFVLALFAFAPIATAQVPNVTIDFEGLPRGTDLIDQYRNVGGANWGVVFGQLPIGGANALPAIIAVSPDASHSGASAATISVCGGEFCTNDIYGRFATAKSHVIVHVGQSGVPGGESALVTLQALDASGNVVGQQVAYIPIGPDAAMLSAYSSSVNITFFRVFANVPGRNYHGLWMDDLTFDLPGGPSPADFGLVPPSGVAVSSGTTTPINLTIRRLNGSAGAIAFTVPSLPVGVTATVAPNPTSGGDGSTVTLSLTTAHDAPPAYRVPVTITGTPAGVEVGPTPRSVTIPLTVGGSFSGFDIRVKGIEVTQGIQAPGVLVPSGSFGNGGSYRGVDLAWGGLTVVRVYADAVAGPESGIPAFVTLSGADADGRNLPDGPLFPISIPPPLVVKPFDGVGPDERVDPSGAYTFVLPPAWTRQLKISLRADLIPIAEPVFLGDTRYTECERADCIANNSYTIHEVDFHPVRAYTLNVLELVTANTVAPLAPVDSVFSAPISWLPMGQGQFVLRGPMAVIRNHDSDLNQQVENWWNDNGHPGDAAMGVEVTAPGGGGGQTWTHTSIASGSRPFTALSHELGHLLGRQHASAACGGADPTKPRSDMNEYEDWPPDQRGYLAGIGLDRRQQSGSAPFRIIAAGVPTPGSEAYDFMSYCAGEDNSWVSMAGWEKIISSRETAPFVVAARWTSAKPALHVTVIRGNSGSVRVTDVRRFVGAPALRGDPSPYLLRAVDEKGRVLSEVPLTGINRHADRGPAFVQLSGDLPAAATMDAVQVLSGGIVVDSRARSAHAPQVKVLPLEGARVAGTGTVVVNWHGSDEDGDHLEARIDYSLDDGRSWRPIAYDANSGKSELPASLFARSWHARVRVVLSDGFNETSAISAPFQADGHPPTVRLSTPGAGLKVRADSSLLLAGSAVDDQFHEIADAQLRWREGDRLLGRGHQIAITGALAPGDHQLKLTASDEFGRSSSAAVVVRVLRVAPAFAELRAPRSLTARDTSLTLRVRTSLPATLDVFGQRVTVGRKARAVVVHFPRGDKPLRLRLRLEANGDTTVRTVTVPRK